MLLIMDKFKKSQILKLFFIAILLSVTPLLSTSVRSPYLYFVFNLLIVALGAEAGLLSFILKAAEDKKSPPPASHETQKPKIIIPSDQDSPNDKEISANTTTKAMLLESEPTTTKKKPEVVEKLSSEKIVAGVNVQKIVKKSPSTPSLFFIAGAETEVEDFSSDDDQQEGVRDELSGQELFHKAETFIGNFYRQLKMQREDSWKKIHELYHKAF